MKDNYKILVAKTDRDDDGKWLPLWMHLRDCAGVMKKLVRRWISSSVINACALSPEEFEKTAVFTAAVHDIGKASAYFQHLISAGCPVLREKLSDAGIPFSSGFFFAGKTPHSYAGEWILISDAVNINVDRTVADVVGAHHGKPLDSPAKDLIKTYEINFYGSENEPEMQKLWMDAWKSIVNEALKLAELNDVSQLPRLNCEAQVLMSALLIAADWIASNTQYFPLISVYENGDHSLYPDRVNKGFEEIALMPGWHPEIIGMDDEMFLERFGFFPNEIQKSVIEAVSSCKTPGLFILEAQMGSGKTEGALAAAELLASQNQAGGIFFGLPTQATCSALFGRLAAWAASVSDDTLSSIRLAHGAAQLNQEYRAFFDNGVSHVNDVEDTADFDRGISVHPWFQGKKKALLADFVIGTVDQFLMASLRRKHFMLRHLGLAGKVVIIDECHAYDAYMNVYLDRTLEWMAAYGIPVILLSATLPSRRREELVRKYVKAYIRYNPNSDRKKNTRPQINCKADAAYPLLTWTDAKRVCQKEIFQRPEKKTVAVIHMDCEERLPEYLNEKLSDGGCACIILNTVRKAQEVYEKISALLDNAEVVLYHARFTMPDRALKEKELLEHMGKNSDQSDRRRFILIGTQVLEQSLDYDADIMITQLCPMDLLLQRMGRLHRHKRKRPQKLEKAVCLIMDEGGCSFDEGTQAVYGKYLLLRTIENLKERIVLPDDIPDLVRKTYEEPSGSCDGETAQAFKEYTNEIKKKEQRAERYVIPAPSLNIEKILENPDEEKENAAQCRVRDSLSSVDVILMAEDENGRISAAGSDSKKMFLDPSGVLTPDEGRFAARQKISLPRIFSSPHLAQKTVSELEEINAKRLSAWQKSQWLAGELVLLLDKNKTAVLCGYELSYSMHEGLKYIKKEKTDA